MARLEGPVGVVAGDALHRDGVGRAIAAHHVLFDGAGSARLLEPPTALEIHGC
jgi:hypothetical protein